MDEILERKCARPVETKYWPVDILLGMPDHIHIFVGHRPTQSCSELMQKVKENSTKWINERRLTKSKFLWQEGFGAFSYSKSSANNVCNYILNQKSHHKKKNFFEEYRGILKEFEVEYDDRYLFKEPV